MTDNHRLADAKPATRPDDAPTDENDDPIFTDGGAVDNDYGDGELSYDEQLERAFEGVQQEPMAGGVAIDIVTRQAMLVKGKKAETCREYYEDEGFDLVTYKMHPWLPGIGADNAVYEAVYLDGNPQNAHKPGRTYDFPSARLMHFPAEMSWGAYEVDGL